MLVKNLTSKQQKFTVKEIMGDHREYDLFVSPNGTTDVENTFVLVGDYKGILETGCVCHCESCTPVVEKKVEETPVAEEVKEVVEEKVEETPEVKESDSFVCDLCGAEFASARGLAAHKNKVHAE